MRIGASAHAGVAAGAAFQIQYQKALCLHQALSQKMIQRHAGGRPETLPVLFLALASETLQAPSNFRKPVRHLVEFFGVDANQLHVIERGAGGGAAPFAKQADLPEISAAAEICQHQLASRMRLGDLDESETNQIE